MRTVEMSLGYSVLGNLIVLYLGVRRKVELVAKTQPDIVQLRHCRARSCRSWLHVRHWFTDSMFDVGASCLGPS